MRPIAIIGFGGHAKVVSSALLSLGRTIVAYTCLEPNVQENRFTQVPLYTDEELLRKFSSDQIEVVLGLGSIKPNLANSLIRKVAKNHLSQMPRNYNHNRCIGVADKIAATTSNQNVTRSMV